MMSTRARLLDALRAAESEPLQAHQDAALKWLANGPSLSIRHQLL